jgi:hypothetical protein
MSTQAIHRFNVAVRLADSVTGYKFDGATPKQLHRVLMRSGFESIAAELWAAAEPLGYFRPGAGAPAAERPTPGAAGRRAPGAGRKPGRFSGIWNGERS